MASPTNAERLAVVETKVSTIEVDVASVKTLLAEIKSDLNRYRGAWGAVTLIVAAIWATITLSKDWIVSHWK